MVQNEHIMPDTFNCTVSVAKRVRLSLADFSRRGSAGMGECHDVSVAMCILRQVFLSSLEQGHESSRVVRTHEKQDASACHLNGAAPQPKARQPHHRTG